MATSKLTLSADKDTIQLAKTIASEDNISVSRLFKTLINEVAKKRKKQSPVLEKYKDVEMPEWIKNLTGVAKDEPGMNYKDMKYEYLKEKYGL